MHETVQSGNFVFDSGRPLITIPEGHSLDNLLAGFSQNVIDIADQSGLAIIGGESGLGKTELFLGTRPEFGVGGITEVLSSQGRTYNYFDASAGVDKTLVSILDPNLGDKPEFVLIDESLKINRPGDSKAITFSHVDQLLKQGIKVVLVGGGNDSASDQNLLIREELSQSGIEIDDEQLLEFPALVLNHAQSVDVLLKRNRGITDEQADEIVNILDRRNIPKIFRVLLQCPLNKQEVLPREFDSLTKHIEFQPI